MRIVIILNLLLLVLFILSGISTARTLLPPTRTGNFYVSSYSADRIAVYDSSGKYIHSFSAEGLNGPRGIVFAPTGAITTITEPPSLLQHFALYQNFPNPFNPQTTIEFELQNSGFVTLNVYNILGQKIITLLSGEMSNGPHKVNFVATSLPSGIYYYSLESGGERIVRRMILMK